MLKILDSDQIGSKTATHKSSVVIPKKNIFLKHKGSDQKSIETKSFTKNSVKDIKKSLLELHKNEHKNLTKTDDEATKAHENEDIVSHAENFTHPESIPRQQSFKQEKKVKDLPSGTKKFVEVNTKEVIYLTSEGKMYTENNYGYAVELKDLSSMVPKDIKMPTKLPIHHKKEPSLSESQSAPMLKKAEPQKQIRLNDNQGQTEPFLSPFTPNYNSQAPFGFGLPSANNLIDPKM